MNSFSTHLTRKVLIAVVAFALFAAVIVTASLSRSDETQGAVDATFSAAVADDPAPATDTDRAQLRADLKAARQLKGQARADALKAIREKALSGAYGDRVEKRADRRTSKHAALLELLPDALQADLAKMREADPAERKELRADIRAKALAGGYGEDVQAAAEKLKHLWKTAPAGR